jgi:polyketide biosynthesis acyl carrier protein
LVRQNIYEVLPDVDGRQLAAADRLTDLGANSVDRAEIVMMSMEALALDVPRAELAAVGTVGGLVDALYTRSCGR